MSESSEFKFANNLRYPFKCSFTYLEDIFLLAFALNKFHFNILSIFCGLLLIIILFLIFFYIFSWYLFNFAFSRFYVHLREKIRSQGSFNDEEDFISEVVKISAQKRESSTFNPILHSYDSKVSLDKKIQNQKQNSL